MPGSVERISYAASFGAAEWELKLDDPLTLMAKRELKKFKAISCRETSGIGICKKTFGVQATHVLDPLLQVCDEFFEQIIVKASSPSSSAKIVHYKLDEDEAFTEALTRLESKVGCKAHNLYRRNGLDNAFEEVGQWVRNLYDSEIVVSDSFHCICLALRFGKKVFYSPNPSRGQARMDDLFQYLGLELEMLSNTTELILLNRGEQFDNNLSRLRNSSSIFLKESLKSMGF